MAWPMSQDYNEAIQDASCFADPELAQAEVVTNALGLPIPCSGNFADVYAVKSAQRKWAVKCFTREIPGLAERYVEISNALSRVQLPFMVEFKFLPQGMRVRGQWYPILKMHWVEGFSLNTFVKNNLDKPAVLQTLCQIWVKLAARLRESGLAHGDLQHGNVMLVPGAKAGALSVRLVDYDGMYLPSLELLKTIEVGHSNYQHPQRQRDGLYNIHVDPFPHLVIYTALRGLMVGGKPLWDKYDNGDNLLFKQADLLAPTRSPLFQELTQSSDKEVRQMSNVLLAAAQKPLEQTPLLERLVAPTPNNTKIQAANPTRAAVTAAAPMSAASANAFAGVVNENGPSSRMGRKKAGSGGMVMAAVAVLGILVAGGGVAAFLVLNNGKKDDGAVALQKDTAPEGTKALPHSSKTTPSEPRTPPSSRTVAPPTTPDTPPPPPPPSGNSLVVTSVPDITLAPGEEGRMEIAFEKDGPLKAFTVNVNGLPGGWLAPKSTIEGRKVLVGISVPSQRQEQTKHLVVTLSMGDEKSVGECSFTVKKKGEPIATGGPKEIRTITNTSGVGRVAVSPDGKTVLGGGTDGIARIWELESGRVLRNFTHKGLLTHVAFSPDGKLALTACGDRSVHIWDAQSGEERRVLEGQSSSGASFSPDSRMVAAGCDDFMIYLSDVAKGEVIRKFVGHTAKVNSANFTPDGKRLFSVSWDQTARLWDIESGKELRSIPHSAKVYTGAVSPDGRLALTGCEDKTVRLIDLANGETRSLSGATGAIWYVGFSRDGSRAISTGPDGKVHVWEVASGRHLLEFRAHNSSSPGVAFLPEGNQAISCGHDNALHLWDLGLPPVGPAPEVSPPTPPPPSLEGLKTAKEVRKYEGPAEPFVAMALSPDGKTALAEGGAGKLCFWDWETGKLNRTIEQNIDTGKYLNQHVHFSPDGRQVIVVSPGEKVVRLWSAVSGELIRSLDIVNAYDGVFSPDGQLICICSANAPFRFFKTATGEEVRTLPGHRGVNSLMFSPDGKYLLSGASDRTSRLWDLSSGKEVYSWDYPLGASAVAVSPDGRTALMGGNDGAIRAFDIETGKVRHVFAGHRRNLFIASVGFSRDGSRAVSTSYDGTFRVWDMKLGRELVVSPDHGGPVTGAAFTPEGNQVISSAKNATVRLWDIGLPPVGPAPEVVVVAIKLDPEKPPTPEKTNPMPEKTVRRKSAVPEEAKLATAEKDIKELYKKEYLKTKSTDRIALAGKLLESTADPKIASADLYVLLREARDLSALAGDFETAMSTETQVEETFDVNATDARAAVLGKFGGVTIPAPTAKVVAEACLPVLQAALEEEKFETAHKVQEVFEASAKTAKILALTKQARGTAEAIAAIEKEKAQVSDAEKKLKDKPDDAAASRALGKYLCVRKHQWAKGLPLLAAGDDEKYSALAKKELAKPTDGKVLLELGDGWWDLAEASDSLGQTTLQLHAADWYSRGRSAATGEILEQVDKRLAQVEAIRHPTDPRELRRLVGLKGRVYGVALSLDVKKILTAGADGSVRLWDVKTGTESAVMRPPTPNEAALVVAFSPDGKYATAGMASGHVGFWDVEKNKLMEGSPLRRIGEISSVSFFADNRVFVTHRNGTTAHADGFVDAPTTSYFARGTKATVIGATTLDGKFFAVGTREGVIALHKVPDLNPTRTFLEGHTEDVLALAISRDAKYLLSGSSDKTARLWDTLTGKTVFILKGHRDRVSCVAMSSEARTLATAGDDQTIQIWDGKTGRLVDKITSHTGAITSLAMSSDGKLLISTSADETVRLWNLSK